MPILITQLQKLLEQLHTLRLQVACIHQLLVVLPPRAHVALLRDELGGFAVVGFQKVDGFLPFGQPEFVLSHYRLYGKSSVNSAINPLWHLNNFQPLPTLFCTKKAGPPGILTLTRIATTLSNNHFSHITTQLPP